MSVLVELDETGKLILIHAEWRFKELCQTIPGARWNDPTNTWRMPVSWTGCLALRSTFKDALEIGPRLGEWAQNELTTRVAPANALRELLDFEGGDADLFAHQRAGVEFLATARQALLADEPGLGKSAQAIRALAYIIKKNPNDHAFPVLVVCPNTLKKNWQREFEKWGPPNRDVLVVTGSAAQKRKQFKDYHDRIKKCQVHGTHAQIESFVEPSADPATLLSTQETMILPGLIVPGCTCYLGLIVNWESLRSHSRLAPYGSIALKKCKEHGGADPKISANACEVHERELNEIEFRSVIADEIHRAKDPKSKQTRALWSASGKADIRFALTGTPLAADVLDLWPTLHWLSPDEWPTKTKWIDRMIDVMSNAFGGLIVLGVKPQMESEFFSALHPRMRRMLKQVVLPWLPEIVYDKRYVEMNPKQAKAYKQMKTKMVAGLDSGGYVVAANSLTQMGRLLQFASAYAEIHVDPDSGDQKVVLSEPSATVDAAFTDLTSGDFGSDSIAISSVSRQLLELMSARLTKAKIPHGMITGLVDVYTRQAAVDDFQSGKTKYILFTAQAGGVGITLTKARRLIRLQRPWSLVDDLQVRDRVHRIGSEVHDSIIVTDYIVAGTVQDAVDAVLDGKADNFEEIVKDQDQLRKLLTTEVF